MYTDIELFKEEQKKFFEELREVNSSEDPDTKNKIREINVKFRDDIRKYLPTCLNIINTTYNCQFSLYKVGKDYDANFKVIETNVKKTYDDLEADFQSLDSSIDINKLSDSDKYKLELAKEILITYVNDPTDPKNNMQERLSTRNVTASSIITNVPKMEQVKTEIENPVVSDVQYNPYADQPIEEEAEEEFNKVTVNEDFSLDIFNIDGSSKPIIEDTKVLYQEPKIVSNPEVVFSQDIFTAPINTEEKEENNKDNNLDTDNMEE